MTSIYHINKQWDLDSDSSTAVTIGNFDGCHRGHQELISAAIAEAKKFNLTAVALTFDPRPDYFFKQPTNHRLLFTRDQKFRAFAESKIDKVVVQNFDENFAQLSAESFVNLYLAQSLKVKSITVGENFRFGYARQGDSATLKQLGEIRRLRIKIRPPVLESSEIISSSRIRNALNLGQVKLAAAMLGRPFLLEGTIIKGDQIGRTLGTPTANIKNLDQIIPAPGVYLVRAHIGDSPSVLTASPIAIPAICNIGYRPTINSSEIELRIETHILVGNIGPNELYGLTLGIYFDERLRDEKKFQNLNELKHAIASDLAIARQFYRISG